MDMQFVEPMGTHRHTVTRCGLCEPAPFRNASANSSVSMQDHGGAFVENFFKAPSSCFDFTGSHVDSALSRESSVIFQIVWAERLLDPIRRIFLVTFAVEQRGWEIGPGIIRIQHQVHAWSDRIACRPNSIFLFIRRQSTNLHLDRAKPSLHIGGKLLGEMLRSFSVKIVPTAGVCRDAISSPAAQISEQGHAG